MKTKLSILVLFALVLSSCNHSTNESNSKDALRVERQKHIENPWFITSECMVNYFNVGMSWGLTDEQKLKASIIITSKFPDILDMEGNVMNHEMARQLCTEYRIENANLGSAAKFKKYWNSTTELSKIWRLFYSTYNKVK